MGTEGKRTPIRVFLVAVSARRRLGALQGPSLTTLLMRGLTRPAELCASFAAGAHARFSFSFSFFFFFASLSFFPRRTTMFTVVPTKNASTDETTAMTLKGMLRSGMGSGMMTLLSTTSSAAAGLPGPLTPPPPPGGKKRIQGATAAGAAAAAAPRTTSATGSGRSRPRELSGGSSWKARRPSLSGTLRVRADPLLGMGIRKLTVRPGVLGPTDLPPQRSSPRSVRKSISSSSRIAASTPLEAQPPSGAPTPGQSVARARSGAAQCGKSSVSTRALGPPAGSRSCTDTMSAPAKGPVGVKYLWAYTPAPVLSCSTRSRCPVSSCATSDSASSAAPGSAMRSRGPSAWVLVQNGRSPAPKSFSSRQRARERFDAASGGNDASTRVSAAAKHVVAAGSRARHRTTGSAPALPDLVEELTLVRSARCTPPPAVASRVRLKARS
mmetsp:Transcript_22112/g.67928  ORF Transcript_22112/g.67928 Transcript_22112/m.67928 type:complete len:440 (+) Transcript_22112:383-1702(+)